MRTLLTWLRRLVIYPLVVVVIVITALLVITNLITSPSNNRNWTRDQAILPHATIRDNEVTISNIRNFTYSSTTAYTQNYYEKSYNLDEIKKVWYVVEPFSGIPGSAHTFLSFEFNNNLFVSISVEIRKEQGESYSPIKGMLNQYELMYVVADERDVIKLRTNYRKDLVYLYPIKTEKARELFLNMIERINKLEQKPEFYNSITNNCTTNIVHHVNTITPNKSPLFDLRVLLPANSDKLAYELGLIDTNLPFEEARSYYYINNRAMKYADDPSFSQRIREHVSE